MSFASPELQDAWLRLLSAVVGTNRSRSSYPHIGEQSSVLYQNANFGAALLIEFIC